MEAVIHQVLQSFVYNIETHTNLPAVMFLAVAKIVEIHELSHSNDYEELGQTACHGNK